MNTDKIDITGPAIEKYLDSLLPEREPWFLDMEKKAIEDGFPAIGPQVGQLLEVLARSVNAKRIMELGSGFGYSGLWFAKALPPDGYILLTDFDGQNKSLAEQNFKRAGKSELMAFRTGDALTILENAEGPFDIIFNDIDKEFYPRVIEPVYKLLRPGGLFITDNTLWEGKTALENLAADDTVTPLVKEFNDRLKAHNGFVTTQLPLRDGVSVSIKI